jgi:hypothetical protein
MTSKEIAARLKESRSMGLIVVRALVFVAAAGSLSIFNNLPRGARYIWHHRAQQSSAVFR